MVHGIRATFCSGQVKASIADLKDHAANLVPSDIDTGLISMRQFCCIQLSLNPMFKFTQSPVSLPLLKLNIEEPSLTGI